MYLEQNPKLYLVKAVISSGHAFFIYSDCISVNEFNIQHKDLTVKKIVKGSLCRENESRKIRILTCRNV
jgi:hypothetical protein